MDRVELMMDNESLREENEGGKIETVKGNCYECAHVIEPQEEAWFCPIKEVNGEMMYKYICEACMLTFHQVLDQAMKEIV